MTEAEQRAAVVAEAREWLRCPFHLNAETKGVGVDCARFIMACYRVVGIGLEIGDIGHAGRDWFMHRHDERFISRVAACGGEVEHPQPGDTALYKIGQSWAHAAIIIDYPMAIHAKWNSGVQWVDVTQPELARLPCKFFSPWAEKTAANGPSEGLESSQDGDGRSARDSDYSAIRNRDVDADHQAG